MGKRNCGLGKTVLVAALLVLFFTGFFGVVTSAADIYVPEGGIQTIQKAVNNARAGDTIHMRDGTYNENVHVNVANLTIRSENGSANCIVKAAKQDLDVFFVSENDVTISGFTMRGAAAFGFAGVCLLDVSYCHISGNNVTSNGDGISILNSHSNLVANNMVADNNYDGIYLELSNGNTIANNTVANNNWEGIFLDFSSDNTFTNNSVSNNTRYDFYSAEHSHSNTVEDLLLCDYPTTVSFTYDNGVGLKSVDTAPSEPSDKMDISKYVDATKVCADSWLFLNVSYDEADLGNVAEDSLRMWVHSGTDWVEVTGTTGVNTAENYVYAYITEFNIIAPLGDPNGLNCTFGDLCVNATGWWRDNGTFNASTTQQIQLAINNATAGETIYVYNGSYIENVNVNKRLTLEGEGAYVVNVTAASASDHVFEVTANCVNITGFTLENATANGKAGIYLGVGVNSCNITNNTVKLNYNGIYLGNADDNNITCNWVHHNTRAGFNLTGGSIGNNISHNNIVENGGLNGSSGGWEWQFYNDQNNITDATNNWWGGGMTNETVNASIYDWTYDKTTGNVTVLPRLSDAAPCAPIPELSTVMLLGVGLLMLAGYLRIRRKG